MVRGTSRMGLLDQLWDDKVAGTGKRSGRLRKYSSFSPSSSAAPAADVQPTVTRSITIARPPSLSVLSGESSSLPSFPFAAESSSTSTPRGGGWRAFRRKSKMANVDVVRTEAAVGPRIPTVYDWLVISSLDR